MRNVFRGDRRPCLVRTTTQIYVSMYVFAGAFLTQKFWGGGIAPSAPSSSSPVSETGKKYKLYIGLHLKSIISTVANFVMG